MADPRRDGGESRPARHSADTGSRPTRNARGSRPRHRKRGSRVGRFFKNLAFTTLVLVLVLAIAAGVGAIVFYNRTNLPDPNKDFQTNTSFIYFNDSKTKLGSLSVQNRQTISYEQMPKSIKEAAISAENRTFWSDQGISIGGIVRAAWTIARGGEMQGGSTITQQYIKILYLSQDRTMQRKLKELVLAV
ncbi:MAG: biosynthetic peptidoglycan transglycosylase, partial [Acidipropionibacterium acidipropionici]